MAQSYGYAVLLVFLLSVQNISAKVAFGKLHTMDTHLQGAKKDAIHSHLQRMLQVEDEPEPEAPGFHPTDDFGIPLPAQSKDSHRPHAGSELRRPSPMRAELEAFLTASSELVPNKEAAAEELTNTATVEAARSGPRDLIQPQQTTGQEAARLASQHAANAAAREAALDRKRQLIKEEHELAAAARRRSARQVADAAAGTSFPVHYTAPSTHLQKQQQAQQRRRTASAAASNTAAVSTAATKSVARDAAPAAASRSFLGNTFIALIGVGAVAALFVAAAVTEDVLRSRHGGRKAGGGSGGGDVLALTRGLWRRCRRAFSAARKQLTGHGSDLPLSANEGAGPLARAVAAASAFVHVFWTHLAADSSLRGAQLHIGGAVAAAIDASRRASAGGYAVYATTDPAAVVPDRESGGGAYATSTASSSPSCYASDSSPFAAPHYQRRRFSVA